MGWMPVGLVVGQRNNNDKSCYCTLLIYSGLSDAEVAVFYSELVGLSVNVIMFRVRKQCIGDNKVD